MEEQYVDENFEIQTRTKDETQIELEKEQATEEAINTEIDRENETPQEFRKKLRAGNGKLKPTSGLCPGYQQANLAFIPDEHVDDFTEFCRVNSGPLPVLHKSYESMDFNAEPLTDDFSDARTDAAGYDVYLEGHVRDHLYSKNSGHLHIKGHRRHGKSGISA